MKEHCPICKKLHEILPLKFDSHGKGYHDLIYCTCGAILKTTVPLFKKTKSGFLFKNININPSPDDDSKKPS